MSTIDKAEEQALGGHHKFGTTLRHASVDERLNAGKQARSTVPRSSHAALPAAGDRPDPITLLEEQAASRVPEPRADPLRPDARLAVRVLPRRRRDHGERPRRHARLRPHVQLCGDAHLSNFGMFASPERQLVFDLNDFDETLPGPWEWDVKRLAASIEVAGREQRLHAQGAPEVVLRDGRGATARRCAVRGMGNLDVWYARLDVDELLAELRSRVKQEREALEQIWPRRARATACSAFSKLTEDGRRRAADHQRPAADRAARRPRSRRRDGRGCDGASCASCSRVYRSRCRPTGGCCWSGSGSSISRARSSGSAASARAPGSCCCSAATTTTRCSSRSRRRRPRCSRSSSRRASTPTTAARGRGPAADAGGERHLPRLAARRARHRRPAARLLRAASSGTGRARSTSRRCAPTGMTSTAELCGWTLARAHARSGDRIAIAAYLGGGDALRPGHRRLRRGLRRPERA